MKVSSSTPLPVYQVLGSKLLIHWNEQTTDREDMDGSVSRVYEYNEARAFTYDTREHLIEKIIASVYSMAQELATINNRDRKPDEHDSYHAFRVQAKALADGWLQRSK
jgi:hypothetical protein